MEPEKLNGPRSSREVEVPFIVTTHGEVRCSDLLRAEKGFYTLCLRLSV